MAGKMIHSLLAEHREAKKILAELGALLGGADPDDSEMSGRETMSIATKSVRELAVEIPNATRVFENLGIDYCCGGHRSLEEACTAANVSVDEVARSLQGQSDLQPEPPRDWRAAPMSELVDHIVEKHHAYVKSETPRLQALLKKVVGVHGKNHPELPRVQAAFSELAGELASHLMKEEQILFPYLRQTSGRKECGASCFGSVQNPIRVMMMEHDGAGEKLREMREATNHYTLPGDACFSYSTLFSALQEFEKDLHQHIHLENNILFPRAIQMES